MKVWQLTLGKAFKGEEVARALNWIVYERGQPQTIKTDNATVESFNGRACAKSV